MLPRPGISENWIKENKIGKKIKTDYTPDDIEEPTKAIDDYARTGIPVSNIYDRRTEEQKSKAKKWLGYLPKKINCYSWYYMGQFKVTAVNSVKWSSETISKVFEQGELSTFLELYRMRHYGVNENEIENRYIRWIVIGFLLGEIERSTLLARMVLQAYRENMIPTKVRPSSAGNLMLRMLGEHIGESVPALPDRFYPERPDFFDTTPYLQEMLAHWKNEEPDVIAPYLVNVCDCHTIHGYQGKADTSHLREFSGGGMQRFPMAALLVLKLRQMRGLENPRIEHPLMETVMGHLPTDAHFVPDDVLSRLRDRMRADGFDESEILKMYGVTGSLPAYWKH
ncbi:MAG: hypothetical protein Q4G70_01350 [Pseudomonadota bacterium]|nr:hypothetical protein [Pseudomonadota bacterium]